MDYYRLNELPQTYKQCKKYTNQFEEWLIKMSKQRGSELAAAIAQQADAKASEKKSNAKGKKRYKVATQHLMPLAQGIVEANLPLEDMSGLRDLGDAIRTRKEVGEYYRYNHQSDESHPAFISILVNIKKVLGELNGRTFLTIAKEHDIECEVKFMGIELSVGESEDEDEPPPQPESVRPESTPAIPHQWKTKASSLTNEELQSEEEFQVLCFLYDFNHLRNTVRQAWIDYKDKKIGMIPAAVVSDLAQSIVQQNVDALAEDLDDNNWGNKIIGIIRKLYGSMSAPEAQPPSPGETAPETQSNDKLYNMLCMGAIDHMEAYWMMKTTGCEDVPEARAQQCNAGQSERPQVIEEKNRLRGYWNGKRHAELKTELLKRDLPVPGFKSERVEALVENDLANAPPADAADAAGTGAPRNEPHKSERPLMPFLMYFDRTRTKDFCLPIFDKFTEDMRSTKSDPKLWLSFGFQLLLDIQAVTGQVYRDVFTDLTSHGMHIANMMRAHMDFEDDMFELGNIPDYMTVGETKFSNCFLSHTQALLDWIKSLSQDGQRGRLNNEIFLALHPILAGLVMHYYNNYYQSVAISKVSWFFVALSHLYNACRQLGGLALSWPDLDFVIEIHGKNRIFFGDPPTDPGALYNRLSLAMGGSLRMRAKDYRGKYIRASKESKKKRGLQTYFPLERKIQEYYGRVHKSDRWIKLHNIFAQLSQAEEDEEGNSKLGDAQGRNVTIADEAQELSKELQNLQAAFTSMATKISAPQLPPQSKDLKKRKKSPRVKTPDLNSIDCIHVKLLDHAAAQLRAHELHSNFDYLSFYRRAFALITHIRGEVLFDARRALETLDTRNENPHNLQLLYDLFHSLRIQDKDESVDAEGDEVSKDVVPLDQLKTIAKIMEDLIREEGDVELEEAKKHMRRNWNTDEPPVLSTYGDRAQGIYHRFTYSRRVLRTRKVIVLRTLTMFRLVFRRTHEGLPKRPAGMRKHCISFKCHGECPIGRGLLGRDVDSTGNRQRPRVDSGIADAVKDMRVPGAWVMDGCSDVLAEEGWETDNNVDQPLKSKCAGKQRSKRKCT